MQHIADVEGHGEDQVYRYNESKCLAWLTKKVKAVAARLQSIGIPPPAVCSSAASAGCSGGSQPTSEDFMVAAHATVARYIPPMLATVLNSSLGKRSSNKCSSRKVTTKAHRRILCRSQPRRSCGQCQVLSNFAELECVCYREIDRVVEAHPEDCTTEHPEFSFLCLNITVLRAAYFELPAQQETMSDDIHKIYRYTACRQFVRWLWRRLAKKHRLILPACVVAKIRASFPADTPTGFRYAEY
ncbi:uncharacterized protein LOC144114739 [Amblyomma americanum]